MSMIDYERTEIARLAVAIKAQGFRVFLSESQTYGFYTDADGSRVVSFQINFLEPRFSGNYRTSNASRTGTGWQIENRAPDFARMFDSMPPRWAHQGEQWRYTTLKEHLETYGPSSHYTEV